MNLLKNNNLLYKNWDEIKKPIRNLWFTFVQGLRCMYHDSYYNNQKNNWDLHFKKSISNLDYNIENFIGKTDNWIDFSRYNELTDEEREHITPLINIFFGGRLNRSSFYR